jgi:hypothetical protein
MNTQDAAMRRRVGDLFLARITGDEELATRTVLALTDDLGLTPVQRIAVSDQLVALSTLGSILVKTLTPERFRAGLPRLIDHATDRIVTSKVL